MTGVPLIPEPSPWMNQGACAAYLVKFFWIFFDFLIAGLSEIDREIDCVFSLFGYARVVEIGFCPCLLGTIRLVFLESVMLWPVLCRSQPTSVFFAGAYRVLLGSDRILSSGN